MLRNVIWIHIMILEHIIFDLLCCLWTRAGATVITVRIVNFIVSSATVLDYRKCDVCYVKDYCSMDKLSY